MREKKKKIIQHQSAPPPRIQKVPPNPRHLPSPTRPNLPNMIRENFFSNLSSRTTPGRPSTAEPEEPQKVEKNPQDPESEG